MKKKRENMEAVATSGLYYYVQAAATGTDVFSRWASTM